MEICQQTNKQTNKQKQIPLAYCKVKQTMYLLCCIILYLEESIQKEHISRDEHLRPYSSSSLTSSAARTVKMNG